MPQTSTTLAGSTPGVTVTVTITEPDPVPAPSPAPDPQPTPAPVSVPSMMAVGATVVAADFAELAAGGRVQGAEFCRTFSPPGAGIADWVSARRQLPKGVAEFHSFKDWDSDTAAVASITHLLDTMPAALLEDEPLLPQLGIHDPDGYGDGRKASDGFSFLLTWCHEGEANMIAAGIPAREWRRRHALAYKTVRQHRNGWRVGYMPVQTGTWTEVHSTAEKVKGDFDPLAWWAGVGDYAGYDAYLMSNTVKPASVSLYRQAPDFLTVAARLAASSGRQLFLPELGVILQGAGPTDSGSLRAAWIRSVIAELHQLGCAGVAWWDAIGTPAADGTGRDFRLLDQPSRDAWQDAIWAR